MALFDRIQIDERAAAPSAEQTNRIQTNIERALKRVSDTLTTLIGVVFGPSGPKHSKGAVPDPGAVAGSTKFLREDATWAVPAGGGGGGASTGDAFVTIGHPADLTAERALTGSATVSVSDGGANNAVTLAVIPGAYGVGMADFTQDLGHSNRSGHFDLTGLSGLVANKNVLLVQTAQPIASKGNARDEFEMDNIELTGYVVDPATIRVYWNAPSVVVGTYAFAYQVSA